MHVLEKWRRFMEPKSVAIIGLTRKTGDGAFNTLENLLSYGYQGRIYPVNPNATEICGIKTYSSVNEITDDIDLAILNTPRSLVPDLAKECIDKGILAMVVVGQGFSDASDAEGKQLQKELTKLARNSKARIIGPNTLGTANAFEKFSSSFARLSMSPVPIGVVCQSGVFFDGPTKVRLIGKGIDVGNACDIDSSEGLEYFEHDTTTKLVVLHIEGAQDGKRFLETSSRIGYKKPVLAIKPGKSERTTKSVQSHTGSMVGKDEIWETAFKQSGIIRVHDVDELEDLTRAFSSLPLMNGRGIAIASLSGAFGSFALDACQDFGLKIAELSSRTKSQLGQLYPAWLDVANPADLGQALINFSSPSRAMEKGLEIVLSDPNVNGTLFISGLFWQEYNEELYEIVVQVANRHKDKPLVCSFLGPSVTEAREQLERAGKTIDFPTVERAVRALARLAQFSEFQRGYGG